MYHSTDPRAALAAAPVGAKPAATHFAGAEYAKFYEMPPAETQGGARTWYARGQNFIIAYSDANKGAVLSRTNQPDEYVVLLNDRNVPRLRISSAYEIVLRDRKGAAKDSEAGKTREYIQGKLNSARWLIQTIEQRRRTMIKVMNCIIREQRDFFYLTLRHVLPGTDPPEQHWRTRGLPQHGFPFPVATATCSTRSLSSGVRCLGLGVRPA